MSFALLDPADFLLQIGKHGIIIEFTDPDYNTRRSATYLPDVAAHEGTLSTNIVQDFMVNSELEGSDGNIIDRTIFDPPPRFNKIKWTSPLV